MEQRISHLVMNANSKENQLPLSVIKFGEYLVSAKKHKSQKTLDSYNNTLNQFFKFIKIFKGRKESIKDKLDTRNNFNDTIVQTSNTSSEFISKITIEDLNFYLDFCEKILGNKTGTLGTKIAILKSYYNFICKKLKIVKHNIGAELESVEPEKRLPIFMDLNETNRLLDTAYNSSKRFSIRNYCLINTFVATAIRISELQSININKIQFEESTLTVIGKGNKERVVYLNESCMDSIKEWMLERSKMNLELLPFEDRDALFISEKHNRISTTEISEIVKQNVKEAGVKKKITCHKIRHTSASLMLKYGHVNVVDLKDILGHCNISTTNIYLHTDSDSLHRAVNSNPTNVKRVRV